VLPQTVQGALARLAGSELAVWYVFVAPWAVVCALVMLGTLFMPVRCACSTHITTWWTITLLQGACN
jgi:hypothetical protein